MLKVGIIVGSTRPGRNSEAVARWVHEIASKRGDAVYEIVDIADYDLPLLDEPKSPMYRDYVNGHTKRWSEKIDSLDAFVFVTPEYNHSITGALKNAIDFLNQEWANKSAGFVSFGSAGGARAVEHLRGIMGELQVADVRAQALLSLFEDFENFSEFKPREVQAQSVEALLDQLIGWGLALRDYRLGLQRREAA